MGPLPAPPGPRPPGAPDQSGRTGQGLRLHPGVFEEPVEAYSGVPQSYECTEWLDLESEAGHGLWLIPSFGQWTAARLLFAAGARRVLVPESPAKVFESPEAAETLRQGEPPAHFPGLTAVHPMGTLAMDDDPAKGPVDSRGKHHGLEGLWVADSSLFPTSVSEEDGVGEGRPGVFPPGGVDAIQQAVDGLALEANGNLPLATANDEVLQPQLPPGSIGTLLHDRSELVEEDDAVEIAGAEGEG